MRLHELTIDVGGGSLVIRQRRFGAWAMALVVLVVGVLWLGAALRLPRELSFICDRAAGACVVTRMNLLRANTIERYPFADVREIRVDTWTTSRSGAEYALVADTAAGPVQLTPYGYEQAKLEDERDHLAEVIAPGGPDRAEVASVRALGFAALTPGFLVLIALAIAALAPFVRIEVDRDLGVLSFTRRSPLHFRTRRERLSSIAGFEIQERVFGDRPIYAALVVVFVGGARLTLCDAADVLTQRDAYTRLQAFLVAPRQT